MAQALATKDITRRKINAFLRLASALLCTALTANTAAQEAAPIQWIDLLPTAEKNAYLAEQQKLVDIPPLPDLGALSPEHDSSWLDRKPIGSSQAVTKHQGALVEIIGYPIPYTAASKNHNVVSFLLVPELGAGLYLPPPPPNQTVRVNVPLTLAEEKQTTPAPDKPVRISGRLSQSQNPQAAYAYVIDATDWHW